jgi:proton-dependent oligopeptide transporter, POT family
MVSIRWPRKSPGKSTDAAFLGHPKGLGVLAFTEAWERFSFYGMKVLLVLYMIDWLLLPDHVRNVVGFSILRSLLESVLGHLSSQALASAVFGLYSGAVYFTPLLGGLLADRLLGRRLTVVIGALLMAAGHFLLAFEQPFLLALIFLILGNGCFKGNIASQVGGLYGIGDLRRASAFQIFYLAINAGVISAPLVCGTLGETLGWHFGFAAAGVGMLIGLAIYIAGGRYLPKDEFDPQRSKIGSEKFTPAEWKSLSILVFMLPVFAAASVGNEQIFNAYLVWARDSAKFSIAGYDIPTTWLITLDTITSVLSLAGVAMFWRAWANRFAEPDEMAKIALGCVISALGLLSLVAGAHTAALSGGKVAIGWLIAFHVLNSIGFANTFPVALSLYSRASPVSLGSTIIGIYYLQLFVANYFVGWLGGRLEYMPATHFWLVHASLVGASALAFLLIRPLIRTALDEREIAEKGILARVPH